jgi:hypothetical protein
VSAVVNISLPDTQTEICFSSLIPFSYYSENIKGDSILAKNFCGDYHLSLYLSRWASERTAAVCADSAAADSQSRPDTAAVCATSATAARPASALRPAPGEHHAAGTARRRPAAGV